VRMGMGMGKLTRTKKMTSLRKLIPCLVPQCPMAIISWI
jgi:hypothetical protein